MIPSPRPRRVVPLMVGLGTVAGHRFTLLSIEDWGEWCDVRFARVDTTGERTLPRRIPPADAWTFTVESGPEPVVEDAVGRGDRHLSVGEVRLRPGLEKTPARIAVRVEVLPGEAPLEGHIDLPAGD